MEAVMFLPVHYECMDVQVDSLGELYIAIGDRRGGLRILVLMPLDSGSVPTLKNDSASRFAGGAYARAITMRKFDMTSLTFSKMYTLTDPYSGGNIVLTRSLLKAVVENEKKHSLEKLLPHSAMDKSVRSINSDSRLLLKSRYTSRIIRVEPFVYAVPICGSKEGAVSNKLDKKRTIIRFC
jgi:hypothetical protein